MIKCDKCGNQEKFYEALVGGYRMHHYIQELNGRWIFDKCEDEKVDSREFRCAVCDADMGHNYRKFLQALFSLYNEELHGP